jgi:DNA-binding CsgD family transcriptional regulator/PAS domain-containing protein
MHTLAPARLSDLIGRIYDCAIDPERWPDTLAEICRAIDCISGSILLIDLEQSRHKFAYTWGVSPDWTRRYLAYSDALTMFYANIFRRQLCPDGEPLVLSPFVEAAGPQAQQIYAELTRPQRISDVMQTVVLREARRLALVGANRHESVGPLKNDDLAIMRLLVPHIRRAVKIVDILDVRKIEAQTLSATLDSFTAGVIVVGDRGRILHANMAARRMLSAREPIAAVNGVLSVHDARADRELANAIALARTDEATIGSSGIGVPLASAELAVAHVLPLARGDLRTRLMPQATAAVFITQAETQPPADIAALAASFGLTPTETRVLEHLAGGATLPQAAKTLGIAHSTAKTHLYHIFSKTGVSRQTDLIALIERLIPPIHRPKRG